MQDVKDAIRHEEPIVLLETVRSLTEGTEYANLVYLGSHAGTPLVADLLQVQSFEAQWKGYFKARRSTGLNDEGLKYLQGRLSTFTGRFATETGFWLTEGEKELDRQIRQDPSIVDAAFERLNAKKRQE